MATEKEKWYTYGVLTVAATVLTYFAFTDYESFIQPDHTSSGKGGKLFTLIVNGIDSLGGKWFVLFLLVALTIYLLFRTIQRFKERKTS